MTESHKRVMQGFCYVYYASAEAAAAAMDHLNGAEFPPSSGHRLKVSVFDLPDLKCTQKTQHLPAPVPNLHGDSSLDDHYTAQHV